VQIDAHHHLWSYNECDFGWITDSMSVLRRDFLWPELQQELEDAKVDSAIVVQARSSLEETRWLMKCAEATKHICGVVGWVPLADPEVHTMLDDFYPGMKFVGVREIAQGQAANFFDDPAFNKGIVELTLRDLSYDILIYRDQLEDVSRFVDRHPQQRFILDHAAKPRIAKREIQPWRAQMLELSKRENVYCKISGLVTEADWINWTFEDIQPYLDTCVEAFGSRRLLAGSDWPVCLVATGYTRWWQTLKRYFESFSEHENAGIFGRNAIHAYNLTQLLSTANETPQ
jgi:L-fuconolactonase